MIRQPLISVIVPIYNDKPFLDQCIDSLSRQTYSNIEIILVDDGSTDGSANICDKWADYDKRIRVIHQENVGAHKARRNGVRIARGEYIGFSDGDDWYDEFAFEYMMGFINQHNVSTVSCGYRYHYGDNSSRKKTMMEEGVYINEKYYSDVIPYFIYSNVFFEPGISASVYSKLFETTRIKKLYQDIEDGGKVGNDTAVVYPYLMGINSIYISHQCIYNYRQRDNSISNSYYERMFETINQHMDILRCYINSSQFHNALIKQFYVYQLYMYTIYVPEIFDVDGADSFLSIFGGIKKDENIAIYGIGKAGKRVHAYLKSLNIDHTLIDKNVSELKTNSQLEVYSPNDVDFGKFDKIIITVLRYQAVISIKKDLEKMGINSKKIQWVPKSYIDNPQKVLASISLKNTINV